MFRSFRSAVAEARRHGDLYFAALLSQDRILKAFGTARWLWQGWIYTPTVTVWVFLSQCLSPDHSCAMPWPGWLPGAWPAVAALFGRHRGLLYGTEQLPEETLQELVREPARGRGRGAANLALARPQVRVADGSTVTMPDTPENQAVSAKESQQPGCGFPIARILVIFSLSVGTVWRRRSESTRQTDRRKQLFRQLHEC